MIPILILGIFFANSYYKGSPLDSHADLGCFFTRIHTIWGPLFDSYTDLGRLIREIHGLRGPLMIPILILDD